MASEAATDETLSQRVDLDAVLDRLVPAPSETSRTALLRLARHPKFSSTASSFPPRKLAAVMVLLFVAEDGRLRVLLTTRSLALRSHPGDTALPGPSARLGRITQELNEAQEDASTLRMQA